MNLANKLTVFRIFLVPVMMLVPIFGLTGSLFGIPMEFIVMNIIFIIASITDQLDGHIARSRNQITTFGKFLDPIADKILVIVAMLMLVEIGHIPYWIPAIVIIREFLVSGYRLVAVGNEGNVIAASIYGKIKTVTQMLGIILALCDVNKFGAFINENLSGGAYALNLTMTLMLFISVIATVFSGYDYLKGSKELFKGEM